MFESFRSYLLDFRYLLASLEEDGSSEKKEKKRITSSNYLKEAIFWALAFICSGLSTSMNHRHGCFAKDLRRLV